MIAILAAYLLSAILSTYPLILKLGHFLPGQPGDAYSYIWNIWIFYYQLLNAQNPFYTYMVMFPIGANLYFNTYAPLISILGLLFHNNLSLYLGTLIIISISISSFFMYLLSFKITKNKIASFVGGLIYGMSPIIQSFIQSQHYYFLFASPFFPLGVLFLINFFEKRRLKFLYQTLGLFWVILLIDYYSSVLYALLILLFIGINEKEKIKNVSKYITIGFISIIVPFIMLFTFDKNFKEFTNFNQEFNTSNSCNTNLFDFIIPSKDNVILKDLSLKIRDVSKTEINYDTPSYYLGWGILVLAILSAIINRKSKFVISFVIIFIFFLIISLGTNIKVGDITILSGKITPFYYFIQVPILGLLDCTIRFPIIMQICIAALISIYISNNKNFMKAACAIIFLVLVEYGVKNVDFSSTSVPSVYLKLATEKNDKTVLELPSGVTESIGAFGYDWSIQALHSKQMYWQTAYQKPRIGVYISRLTPDKYLFFREEPVISEIFNYTSLGGSKPESDIPETKIERFINKFNLGYIILSPNVRQNEFAEFIEIEFSNHIKDKSIIEGFVLYRLLESHS